MDTEETIHHLYGSCACHRNQFTIVVPPNEARLARVYFDNTASSPWLRVPLAWYYSSTYAHFRDETHSSIKRSFYSPSTSPSNVPPTRRQFCGYCGTHLTAWSEHDPSTSSASQALTSKDYLDITLASLLSSSLERLETLDILPSPASSETAGEDEEERREEELSSPVAKAISSAPDFGAQGGLVKDAEASIIPAAHFREDEMTGHVSQAQNTTEVREGGSSSLHRLAGRGVPYFEDLVEDSRLGRIKRRAGGGVSGDGTVRIEWEVVEIDNGEEDEVMGEGGGEGRADPVAGVKRGRQNS